MGKKKLLVEGKNDQIVISTLCEKHDIWVKNRGHESKKKPKEKPFAFDCVNRTSVEQLLDRVAFESELAESDLETMGIVVDADDNLAGRWQSVTDRLQECGFPRAALPSQPDSNGTVIVAPDLPRVGVWLMPDNQLGGKLEDFVKLLIPEADDLWPYAQNCVAGIAPTERLFTDVDLIKAQIHTWLAWRKEPGIPMGVAITSRCLDANSPQAQVFVEWLRRLFEI